MSDEKPKALFVHCQTVYSAMKEKSEIQVIDDQSLRIYKGYLTNLIVNDLSLPNSYYTYIMDELKRMDCARRIKRGGGASQSEWLLLKEPTIFDFENMPELKKDMSPKDVIEAQFKKNVLERLNNIEKAMGITREFDEDAEQV